MSTYLGSDLVSLGSSTVKVNGGVVDISFSSEFAGSLFTVTGGGQTLTGVVPLSLQASVGGLTHTRTTYTITATADGVRHQGYFTTGEYFGRQQAYLHVGNVFGVVWDASKSSTQLARLTTESDPYGYVDVDITSEPVPAVGTGVGSSPFDSFMPWQGMEEYNVINDEIAYRKGEEGFSRADYDTVVHIPEFYYKTVYDADSNKWYFYISNGNYRDFAPHPGSDRYVGKYNTISGYYSKTGAAPLTNISRTVARTGSMRKGEHWYQYDFSTWSAIQYLYLVEFADFNSQAVIGSGIVSGSKQNVGLTDVMSYHTGQVVAGSAVLYRNIENPWGNVNDWCDGLNAVDRRVYVGLDPDTYTDDSQYANYIDTGITLPTNGYIKQYGFSESVPFALIPKTSGGNASAYVSDYVYSVAGYMALCVGGSYAGGSDAGLFCFRAGDAASSSRSNIGARLLFIP